MTTGEFLTTVIGGPEPCAICQALVRLRHMDAHLEWHRRIEVTPDAVLTAVREAYLISAAYDPVDPDDPDGTE